MCSFHVSSLEDFTAAMDAVNVDLDEMRARAALLQTLLLPFYKQSTLTGLGKTLSLAA